VPELISRIKIVVLQKKKIEQDSSSGGVSIHRMSSKKVIPAKGGTTDILRFARGGKVLLKGGGKRFRGTRRGERDQVGSSPKEKKGEKIK